jgi:hypothetical protein
MRRGFEDREAFVFESLLPVHFIATLALPRFCLLLTRPLVLRSFLLSRSRHLSLPPPLFLFL